MGRTTPSGLMTELEVLRLLSFADNVRRPFEHLIEGSVPDPTWNIVRHLVQAQLRGETVAISALAQTAGVPYTTALRRIEAMVDRGLISRRARGRTGRSFGLEPTDSLLRQVYGYLRELKSMIGQTVGARQQAEDVDDFYFGGPPPGALASPSRPPHGSGKPPAAGLRFLCDDDNYFKAMRSLWGDFRSSTGSQRDFDLAALPELYDRLLENSREHCSRFDVVAVNMPWLGGLAAAGLLHDLGTHLATAGISEENFHPTVWSAGQWCDAQYAVPIYCTSESLAVRRDLLTQAGCPTPSTFDRVIDVGRSLHNPSRGLHGVVWNAARGMPIASSFMFGLGCCGRPILRAGPDADAAQRGGLLDLSAAAAVLDYMHRLKEISPPNVLELDWEASLDVFLEGHAAMTYCWTMRAVRFEYDIRSRVQRKVAYLPQPAGPGGRPSAPLGGFMLAVPSNVAAERVAGAVEAIAWMTSPETMGTYARDGFPVLPLFSFASDPEVMRGSGIVRFVEGLARRHLLDARTRPPIPEYRGMETIIGEEVHDAVSRRKTDGQAIAAMGSRMARLFEDAA